MHASEIEGAYRQSVEGCLEGAVGEAGLTEAQLDSWLSKTDNALVRLHQSYQRGELELFDVATALEDKVAAVEHAYQKLSQSARTMVFFGTGGSTLGGQTLAQFGGWSIPGIAGKGQSGRPITRFFGNLDPATMQGVMDRDDLAAHRFVLISKSGGTPETLSQALAAIAAARTAGLADHIPSMFLGISDPPLAGRRNGLRDLCARYSIPVIDHPPGIGGRFAILTAVGLLPAVARGLNARALLAGAKAVIDNALGNTAADKVPAAIGAAVVTALYRERAKRVLVMMPYADRLAQFAHWYVQLWAESLGKDGQGTTPLACLGPLDQHSQLQLFMDGPNEHMLTFVRTPLAGGGPTIPGDLAALAGLDAMAERTIGDLVAAQTVAVPEALRQAGRAVRTFDIPQLGEYALGGLVMHFMIETILAGDLMGVDPFGQPAVELGKQLTRQHLAGLA